MPTGHTAVMTKLIRVALALSALLISTPELAQIEAQPEARTEAQTVGCSTTPTVFEMGSSRGISARSGGYYPAQQMSLAITPESWSQKGLGLVLESLDTSGAMAWGIGPRWYRRFADSDDFSATIFAQAAAGKMDTALVITPETKGRFIDTAIGATVGYKNYTIGLEAHYADAPTLAPTKSPVGAVKGSRVMLHMGYGFKHYSGDVGPCATSERHLAEVKAAEDARQQRAATQPHLELGIAANGPQHAYAEFPGIALSAVQLHPKSPAWGWASLAEYDGSYVRQGWTAGARIYSRSQGLQDGNFGVTPFAQLMVGVTAGGDSGIIHSVGGPTIQPGVGIVVGGGQRAFLVQVDYRSVRGGAIRNDREPGASQSMTSQRISIGYVMRFDRR